MSKFVTLVLEPRFNDEYGEYANLPVFNAHGDIVGYTGGEVPETGNPCEFYVMDEEGFPACHSASENAKLIVKLNAEHIVRQNVEAENAKLRELVRDAWGSGHPDRSCESCDIRDECHDDIERMRKDGVLRFSRCLFELRIEERMRELGVEVD